MSTFYDDIVGLLERAEVQPDTLEGGRKALDAILGQLPILTVQYPPLLGMRITCSPVVPENEIHVVSYRREGGQLVRTLHKIFSLEVC